LTATFPGGVGREEEQPAVPMITSAQNTRQTFRDIDVVPEREGMGVLDREGRTGNPSGNSGRPKRPVAERGSLTEEVN
jgi:hypothetical protein